MTTFAILLAYIVGSGAFAIGLGFFIHRAEERAIDRELGRGRR